jgi:hypothetical protein
MLAAIGIHDGQQLTHLAITVTRHHAIGGGLLKNIPLCITLIPPFGVALGHLTNGTIPIFIVGDLPIGQLNGR